MIGDLVLQRGFRITRTIESPTAVTVVFSRKSLPTARGKGVPPLPVYPNPKVKVLREKGRPRFYWLILPWFSDPSKKQFEVVALRLFDESLAPQA